jgi:hypothetical protein
VEAYGGKRDLWDTTLTAADVNSSRFGVAFRAYEPTGIARAVGKIENVRLTVYYSRGAQILRSTGIPTSASSLPGSQEGTVLVDRFGNPLGSHAEGVNQITSSFASSSSANANARWRLAFWRYLLRQSIHDPVFGVGFGKPADFTWHGVTYDPRSQAPGAPASDVTGAHNSFVAMLYRAGAPALLATLALMVVAVARLVPLIRRTSGEDRALAIWPLAALAIATGQASFNVVLEGPYMGIFFWAALGLALLAPLFLGKAGGKLRA